MGELKPLHLSCHPLAVAPGKGVFAVHFWLYNVKMPVFPFHHITLSKRGLRDSSMGSMQTLLVGVLGSVPEHHGK